MITAILIIYLFVVVLMVGTILIQKNEGGGLVSSNTGGLVTSRGAKNFLTRLTATLAALFFGLSILLAILFKSDSHKRTSFMSNKPSQEISSKPVQNEGETKPIEKDAPSPEESAPKPDKPTEPSAPVAQ